MPIQVQRYVCKLCLSEHRDMMSAIECESLPQTEQFHPVGTEATFESESQLGASRYSYVTLTGKVIYAYLDHCTFNDGTRMHVWQYVIEVEQRGEKVEYHANGGKVWGLFSPSNSCFSSGFANSIKQAHENPQ